jgi:biotin carboxyl carrier protein
MTTLVTIGGRAVRVEVRRKAGGGYAVSVEGRPCEVDATQAGPFLSLRIDGRTYDLGLARRAGVLHAEWAGGAAPLQLASGLPGGDAALTRAATGPARVIAPMPGKVVRVLVGTGQDVAAGAGLVVVDAMKMENELRAPRAGRVLELPAREGQAVEAGALLAVVG